MSNPLPLSGSEHQLEWAERTGRQVNARFGRVAEAFRSVAGTQRPDGGTGTEAILAILEGTRAESMSRDQARQFYSRLAGDHRSGSPTDLRRSSPSSDQEQTKPEI